MNADVFRNGPTNGPALDFGASRHALAWPLIIVGRATGDWRTAPDIDLGSPVVSRRHAQLESGGNGVLLRDLGSSNGTTVQGQLLSEGELVLLREGDVISFGGVEGRFEASAPWPEGLRPAWNPEAPADLTRPGPR